MVTGSLMPDRRPSSMVVPPKVRRVRLDRQPDLTVIPNESGLRDRVAAALASTPIDPDTGTPVATGLRRIFLGPGGMPWDPVNAWLLHTKEKADGTERQYASVVRMWVEHCAQRNKDPLHITYDTVEDWRQTRIDEDGIEPDTWNENLAPLKWFHETAPVLTEMTDRDWKDLRLRGDRVGLPRVVPPDVYIRFRAVGLQAHDLHNGRATPAAYRLRTPVRDVLFADFLLAHGARRVEGCHLTLLDLPPRRDGLAYNLGTLPAPICKGRVSRPWREQRRWVERLAAYHNTEWPTTVEQAQRTLRAMRDRGELLLVTDVSDRFGKARLAIEGLGKPRALTSLTREQRRRLVCTPDVAYRIAHENGMGAAGLTWAAESGYVVPLALFPGTRTPMLTPEAWGLTFREANDRVNAAVQARHPQAQDVQRVTPHMLRHTFATRFLTEELERLAESDREFAEAYANGDTARLRRRFFSPLLDLQELLGHRYLETTMRYIRYVSQQQQAAYMPGDSWIESYVRGI